MLTYTGLRNLFGDLTNNTSSTNLTLADTLINTTIREILGRRAWPFLEKTASASTAASTQFYALPYDLAKLVSVTVTIGSSVYSPKLAPSREFWDKLNASTSITSNAPEWYFVFNGQLGFYPIPSSTTSNAITYIYKRAVRDLVNADYTTGTITTATNASTGIVGSGTTWAASMAGRYFRITSPTGDGYWYEIASSGSTTALTLSKSYQGTSIAAGSAAYTIGETSLLPENYQVLPVYRALEIYFTSVQPEPQRALMYKNLYQELYNQFSAEYGSTTTNPVLNDGTRATMMNPNLFPTNLA